MSRRTHPTILRVDLAPAAQLGRRRPNRIHNALWAVTIGGRRITGWTDEPTAQRWATEYGGRVTAHHTAKEKSR